MPVVSAKDDKVIAVCSQVSNSIFHDTYMGLQSLKGKS